MIRQVNKELSMSEEKDDKKRQEIICVRLSAHELLLLEEIVLQNKFLTQSEALRHLIRKEFL
jgi:hypothetical protein